MHVKGSLVTWLMPSLALGFLHQRLREVDAWQGQGNNQLFDW